MARKPGQTFPSDHRRWFRVREDILDDDKLAKVSAEVFRFYFRLLAMLNRIKSRNGRIRLDKFALNACASREQRRHSLRTARAGAEAGLYRMSEDGLETLFVVRKWAETQYPAPAEPQRSPEKTPATTPTPKTTPKTKKRESTRPPTEPQTGCPEKLPEPHQANATEWAAAQGIGEIALAFRWERVRRWSEQNPSKLRTANGWYATLRNAVEDRWGGDLNLNAPPDESPAQGRQRRTREAATDALAILKNREAERKLELVAGSQP